MWNRILAAGWDTFKAGGRTNVDLKDRWRIMTAATIKGKAEGA